MKSSYKETRHGDQDLDPAKRQTAADHRQNTFDDCVLNEESSVAEARGACLELLDGEERSFLGESDSPPKVTQRAPQHEATPPEKTEQSWTDKLRAVRHQANLVSGAIDTGIETLEKVQQMGQHLAKIVKFEDSDTIGQSLISRIEALVLAMVSISSSTSLVNAATTTMLYVKTWTGSLTVSNRIVSLIFSLIKERADKGFEAQAGYFTENWRELVKGEFGKKMASIINVGILTGILPSTMQNMVAKEVCNALDVHMRRKECSSIFEHLFTVLDWVVDYAFPAFQTDRKSVV